MAEAKVLLFHKDSKVLKNLSMALSGSNLSVMSSSDRKYTIELARQEKPHFLIWGGELNQQAKKSIRELKQSDIGDEISIIAAADTDEVKIYDRIEAQHYGIDDYIPQFEDVTEIQSRIQFHQKLLNQVKFSKSRVSRFKKLSQTTLSLMLTRGIVNICESLNDYFSTEYELRFHVIAVDSSRMGEFDYFNLSNPSGDLAVSVDAVKADKIWKEHFTAAKELEKGEVTNVDVLKRFRSWGLKFDKLYQFPLEPRGKSVGAVVFALEADTQIDSEEEILLAALTRAAAQRLIEVKRIYSLERDSTKSGSDDKNYFEKPSENEIQVLLSKLIISKYHTDVCLYINYHEGFKFLYPKFCYLGDQHNNLFEKDKPPVLLLKDFSVFESIVRDKKTFIFDLKQDARAQELKKLPVIEGLEINHIIVFTLAVGQTIQGFFILGRESFLKKFSKNEIQEIEILISKAVAALEENQILKQAKLTIKQLNRIFDLGSELTLDLTLDKILKRICDAIRRTLAWNVVMLDIKNQYDDTYTNVEILGLNEKAYKNLIDIAGYPPFESRMGTSFPINNSYFFDHKQKYSETDPSLITQYQQQIGSEWNDDDWVYIPIKSRGNLLGVISLNDPVERKRPTEERIRSVEYFANQAAVIIENYELIEGVKSSELKYRLLAETMTMGLVTCDSNRNIVYVNQSLAQFLKYEKPDQLIENNLSDFCTASSKHTLIKAVHETLQRGEDAPENATEGFELELVAKDGEEIPFMIYMSPFFQHGKKVGFFGVLADLRNQKKIERLKSDFNSMIVHDLRSPLNIIQGYVDIVRTEVVGTITEEQAELLTIAKENVFKVLKLIDNFLTASKLEAGHFQIEPSINSLNGLIETLWDHYQVLANEKKIKLEKELDDSLPLISFDKFRIEQVVRNFLSNALKFTPPEGKITITTKLKKEKNKETKDIQMFADVMVSDTGVGISEEELGKVFNKYEQTEAGKDASLKGTGLGLAICREIVELHSGEVWVKSKLHDGSDFGFSLPIQAVKL